MHRDFETIAREAEQLDLPERHKLAERLVENLIETSEHRRAGFAESRRRVEAVERGEMKTVDGPEALARVRKLVQR